MIKVPNSIVSSEWLKEHLNDKNLIVLDATIPKVTNKGEQKLINKIRSVMLFFLSQEVGFQIL